MNHLTLTERKKLAELRRRVQKAPPPREVLIIRKPEGRRVDKGIAFLTGMVLLVFLGYFLREVKFEGLPEEFMNFFWWLWRTPLW